MVYYNDICRYMTHYWPAGMISLYRSVVVAKFKMTTYAPFRKQIQNTLGNKAVDFIYEIDI